MEGSTTLGRENFDTPKWYSPPFSSGQVHPCLTKIVPGPGLILLMIQQMILLVNLSFEVCISIFNKNFILRTRNWAKLAIL